jgi:hypothetical protein
MSIVCDAWMVMPFPEGRLGMFDNGHSWTLQSVAVAGAVMK